MPERFVLDSFALVALFQNEVSASRVESLIERAAQGACELSITSVNLGEVIYLIQQRRGPEQAADVLRGFDRAPISLVDVDRELALDAAHLKAEHRMGYLDCFVAALARQLDAAVVTGDPDFQQVEHVVAIEWLPPGEDDPQ